MTAVATYDCAGVQLRNSHYRPPLAKLSAQYASLGPTVSTIGLPWPHCQYYKPPFLQAGLKEEGESPEALLMEEMGAKGQRLSWLELD